MTKLYKLTDQDGYTYKRTRWGPGVTHSSTGKGWLCGPGWIHAYTDPLVAVLLNPIDANLQRPRLWEAEGDVVLTNYGMKVGCKSLTTVREISVPKVTAKQHIRFGIICALEVCNHSKWRRWADAWLDCDDRNKSPLALKPRALKPLVNLPRVALSAAMKAAQSASWAAQLLDSSAEVAVVEAAEAAAWAVRAKLPDELDLPALARKTLEITI